MPLQKPQKDTAADLPDAGELSPNLESSLQRYVNLNSDYKGLEEVLKGVKGTRSRPAVLGLSDIIQSLILDAGFQVVKVQVGTESYKAAVTPGASTTVSKDRLLELGVDPKIILAATVTTPWMSLRITPLGERAGGGGAE